VNQYQKVIVVVAALNIVLLLMFPPVLGTSILRSAGHGFDSFMPLYQVLGKRQIYWDLLTIEIIFIAINALAAWLVMQHSGEKPGRRVAFDHGLLIFGAMDLALIFCFPPFQQYSTLIRVEMPRFDGFYFLLGDKMQRHFYVPLLYLECMVILVDLLLLYLMFNIVRRSLSPTESRLLELARDLPPEKLSELSEAVAVEVQALHSGQPVAPANRRRGGETGFVGSERRAGYERRKRPRSGGK
jgi:hypothetical protein